jgi:hypothetical protein
MSLIYRERPDSPADRPAPRAHCGARLTRAGRPLFSISGATVKVLVGAFALLGVLVDS